MGLWIKKGAGHLGIDILSNNTRVDVLLRSGRCEVGLGSWYHVYIKF